MLLSTACATAGYKANAGAADRARTVSRGAAALILAPEVSDGFTFLYRFIGETEFVLCLEGEALPGSIRVDGFRLARILSTRVDGVRYVPCSGTRYIGTAHNHPSSLGENVCYQSEIDRRGFAEDARAVIDIILCGEYEFVWLQKDTARQPPPTGAS